jgi:hypothetical protein
MTFLHFTPGTNLMFSKTLTQAGHTRRFIVNARHTSGWEVRIEQDSTVVRQVLYTDWHRVERALDSIEREVGALQARGWAPVPGGAGVESQSTNL